MKKEKSAFNRNSPLYYIVFGICVIIISLILYPLGDWIICSVFTHSPFVYSVKQHIVLPCVTGIFVAVLFFAADKLFKKKENNSDKQ